MGADMQAQNALHPSSRAHQLSGGCITVALLKFFPRAAASPAADPSLLHAALRDLWVVAVCLLALSATVSGWLGVGYVVKVALGYAAPAWLAWRGLRRGAHPHAGLGAANRVTLGRLALVVSLAGLWGEAVPRPGALSWAVVAVAAVAALLDGVDGRLARRSGQASDFGARFDMETDAACTLVLSGLVWQAGQAGPWVLAAGLMRYAFWAAAWLWPWLAAPLPRSRGRQAVCAVQIGALVVCLGPVVPPWWAALLAAGSVALLGLSFGRDVVALARGRRAWAPRPA